VDAGKTRPSAPVYEFGPFRLDSLRRTLERGAEALPVTSKMFDMLLALVESRGLTLGKDELLQTVWPDAVVEEKNLAVNISALRKILGENPAEHRYIVTVPGQGYRFVAAVTIASDQGEEPRTPAAGRSSGGPTPSAIRVVIADDHPILLRGLRQAVELDPYLLVVAEADGGASAILQIAAKRPDVAVVDIDMPGTDGLEVVRELARRGVQVPTVFLTMHDREDLFNDAMDLGVKGYVLKDSLVDEIVDGIRTVAAGRHYVSPSLSSYLVNRGVRTASLRCRTPGPGDLTPVEQRILSMIAEDKSSKDIADQLCIHYRTVENHRTTICAKLGIHGSNALLRYALQHRDDLGRRPVRTRAR